MNASKEVASSPSDSASGAPKGDAALGTADAFTGRKRAKDFKLYTLEQLNDLPPAEWLIEPLFQADSQVLLYGPSGEGKTFVALSFALSIATGLPWLDLPVKKGPVVYVAAEGGRGIRKRIKAWMKEHHVAKLKSVFVVLDAVQLCKEDQLELFKKQVQSVKPVLIVLDTFARTFVGKDENTAQDVGVWVEASQQLQVATGATVLTIHHSGKPTKGTKQPAERGSSALRGAADAMILVTKKKDGLFNITCTKQKDEEEFAPIHLIGKPVHVASKDGEINSLVLMRADASHPELEHPKLSRGAELAYTALSGLGGSASKAGWHAAATADPKAPFPDRTFMNWVNELLGAGDVVRVRRGIYQMKSEGTAMAFLLPAGAGWHAA